MPTLSISSIEILAGKRPCDPCLEEGVTVDPPGTEPVPAVVRVDGARGVPSRLLCRECVLAELDDLLDLGERLAAEAAG